MRADVWRDVLLRFGDFRITEFYGATELNFSLFNYIGKIGSVGRHTFLNGVKRRFWPAASRSVGSKGNVWPFLSVLQKSYGLIQYDTDKGEPVRDASGLCVAAAKGA